jgi:DNA-binding HxlR family transcriptional regulator
MPDESTVYGPKEECLKALKMFGDYWTLAIIFCLRDGPMRFLELQKEMGVNPVTLSSRLKTLTRNGLLIRRKFDLDKQSVSYELTSLGQESVPIVQLIILFSAKLKRRNPQRRKIAYENHRSRNNRIVLSSEQRKRR